MSAEGRALIERFNMQAPGTSFHARVEDYSPALRIWLLEAGARHRAQRADDGAWHLEIRRGAAPAQGSIPGLHHVVTDGISVWTCERGQSVARIDAATGQPVAVKALARKASHLALDAHAGRLIVADSEANELLALRAADLELEDRWSAPGAPQLPLIAPDGTVCVTGGTSATLTIVRAGQRAQAIAVGACPHDPLLDAHGTHVFVPCAGSSEVVKVRLADGRIVGRCPAGEGPSHLALHPDGTRLYAANSWDGTVSCLSSDGEYIAAVPSGGWAHAIDIHPGGKWLYVANFLDDTLAVFDALSLERVALLPTEAYPHGLDVSPDGRHVIATGFASDHVRVFDAESHRELARIAVGGGSSHSAFARGSAFVGCSVSDHVACLCLRSFTVQRRIAIH